MGLFNRSKKNGGFMDEIRCDEHSYLIWKWHPAGVANGESDRENAVRLGSSLRVKDGEVAVFVYKQKNGVMQDFIIGPFDETIKTKNLPVLASIIGLAYEGGTPFQAEVYFINLAHVVQVRFGVPFFDVFDPSFPEFGVPVAVRGTISFKIRDYKEFIQLHRLQTFSLEDFQNQIRHAVARYIKDTVSNAPAAHNIPLVQIETKIGQINDVVEYEIRERLKEDFGVLVSGVDIGAIELDKSSEGYGQLMSVTKDIVTKTVRAEAEAKVKNIADKQRIESEHYEETLRIQREESQYAQHKQTQTTNIGAFQIEKQAEVGIAGATAFGQIGSNGAGEIPISGGEGFNMAAMMASLSVGGAIGKNIATMMNDTVTGLNQPVLMQNIGTPPVPSNTYHVAMNGQATGPYDMTTLSQMIAAGQLRANSLVWRTGMPNWVQANSVDELKALFLATMPPVPSSE